MRRHFSLSGENASNILLQINIEIKFKNNITDLLANTSGHKMSYFTETKILMSVKL